MPCSRIRKPNVVRTGTLFVGEGMLGAVHARQSDDIPT